MKLTLNEIGLMQGLAAERKLADWNKNQAEICEGLADVCDMLKEKYGDQQVLRKGKKQEIIRFSEYAQTFRDFGKIHYGAWTKWEKIKKELCLSK